MTVEMDFVTLEYFQSNRITCLVQFSHFSFLFVMVTSDIVHEIPAKKEAKAMWQKSFHLTVEFKVRAETTSFPSSIML